MSKNPIVLNYKPISFLYDFSKLFEFFIFGRFSHYLQFKISPHQHDVSKSKSTITQFGN
jgi:hypothetical protein